ncbi:MAG: aminotransferase class I/II-fold pyridoxal phosphate-dependent enzyme [Elusimicrobia bacterium]|nr:aminotransferase class I/II-fold pyridoxal phosphate-dependent enzyme [Elusimicrobiota bacterium]
MRLKPFALERYFARHEFSTPLLLGSSDCEPLGLSELLALADAETASLWSSLRLGYTESQGAPALRREIAATYADVDAEQVLTVVPEEGIFLALHALLEPDDHVVCTYPGYQSLYEVARSIGCPVDRWMPVETEEGWRFDVAGLERVLERRTKLVVVNFPHNPTGALPSVDEFSRVAQLCRQAGARLFSDELYRGLEQDPRARLPSACEVSESAVALGGLSKAYGLAGLRLGWLVARDDRVRRRLCELKDYTTICGSAPSEVLALIALRARAVIVESHRARLAAHLRLLDDFFYARRSLFRWLRPLAGSVCFPGLAGGVDADALCREAARDAGVLLVPSTVYGLERPYLRVGFGRANLPEALSRFGDFLARRPAPSV